MSTSQLRQLSRYINRLSDEVEEALAAPSAAVVVKDTNLQQRLAYVSEYLQAAL
jgi:hypothetical protein